MRLPSSDGFRGLLLAFRLHLWSLGRTIRSVDNQPYRLAAGQDPLDIDAYMRPDARRYIVALGLIADATNENEATARSMVGVAIGLWEYVHIEAAFLGERIGALSRRMQALAQLPGAQPSVDQTEACDWMKRAAQLNERRDELIHRPTWTGVVDDRVGQLLRRGRRKHQVEPLRNQAEDLVRDLFASVKEGKNVLVHYVESEHARRHP